MKDKVLSYVYSTWYQSKCHKKEDIERVICDVIRENPEEADIVKLGVKAKRRCISEL